MPIIGLAKVIAFYDLSMFDAAIAAYDNVIRIDPKFASAWHNKGLALQSLGRISESEVAFAKEKEIGLF